MNSPGPDVEDAKTIDEIARALVRPIVTVLFAMAFIYFTATGQISGEVFSGAAITAISFWFASRNQEHTDSTIQSQQKEIVELAKAVPPDNVPPDPLAPKGRPS